MSQTYDFPIVGTDLVSVALKTKISDAMDAVRTSFSGATAPLVTAPYQLWADTTTGLLKRRNAGDTDWDVIGMLSNDNSRIVTTVSLGDLSATDSKLILAPRTGALIEAVTLIGETTTSHDNSNKYVFMLENVTDTLDLFSGTVGTFDTLGGVGGGAMTANTKYTLTPDQNATIGADDVLRFEWTKTGSPANVVGVLLQLDWAQR